MTTNTTPMTTLVTMLDRVADATSLSEARRRELASGISTFCRVLHTQPHMVEATAANLQGLIRVALPAALGVTATRWRNVTSLMRAGMTLIDPDAFPARLKARRLTSWSALFDLPEAAPFRRGLSRLSKWCSLNGIELTDVSDTVLERFHNELAAHCVLRCPREAQQTAGRTWNAAMAVVPGWPAVTLRIPDRRKNPSMPWSAFPASLEQDVEAFLADCALEDDSLDTDRNPLRPATIYNHRVRLRRIATAIVESGVAPGQLASLADMVIPARACAALEILRRRSGKKTTGDAHKLSQLLLTVARHHVQADDDVIAKLVGYRRKLKPKKHTLTAKNRARLAQFDDPRQMDKFLLLPDRLMHAAIRIKEPTVTEALLAQEAVLLSILQYVPIRIGNIAALELGRSMVLAERTGEIVLSCHEVKNDIDITCPLPTRLVDLIKLYLKEFHPLPAPPGCTMLFPSRNGSHKHSTVLGRQVTKRVRTECGIEFNPHLARHLAAKIMLETSPGAYGTVMQLLHHKQIQTTIDSYCGTEDRAAFGRYTTMLDGRRDAIGPRGK